MFLTDETLPPATGQGNCLGGCLRLFCRIALPEPYEGPGG